MLVRPVAKSEMLAGNFTGNFAFIISIQMETSSNNC
jgi:hypothetical protein